jgi:hypothetical protein
MQFTTRFFAFNVPAVLPRLIVAVAEGWSGWWLRRSFGGSFAGRQDSESGERWRDWVERTLKKGGDEGAHS